MAERTEYQRISTSQAVPLGPLRRAFFLQESRPAGGQVGDGVRLWRMDWIGGTARCVVGLIYYRFRSVGNPHPTRALPGPPSPSGKALSTRYKLEMLYFLMIYGTAQSLPLGGKVAAKRTNEGYVAQAVRRVLRQNGTTRNHESNPPPPAATISAPAAPAV